MMIVIAEYFPQFRFRFVIQPSNNVKIT